jgi:hypothetical protein
LSSENLFYASFQGMEVLKEKYMWNIKYKIYAFPSLVLIKKFHHLIHHFVHNYRKWQKQQQLLLPPTYTRGFKNRNCLHMLRNKTEKEYREKGEQNVAILVNKSLTSFFSATHLNVYAKWKIAPTGINHAVTTT